MLREYADRLNVTDATPVITLGEGGTPLIPAAALSARTGAKVWVKFEGMNPTGSFKDRGMTMAISRPSSTARRPSSARPPATPRPPRPPTPPTPASPPPCWCPRARSRMGKLSQAIAHNAQLLQVQGNFDDCLDIARDLAANYPVHLVNSVNPDRIEGQKTAAFEVVEVLGDAPDFHFVPVGNAGNYTAYHRGYTRGARARRDHASCPACSASRPRAARRSSSATSSRTPRRSRARSASATRPRGSSRSTRASDSDGYFGAIDDARILEAHRILVRRGRHLRRAAPPRSASPACSSAPRPA